MGNDAATVTITTVRQRVYDMLKEEWNVLLENNISFFGPPMNINLNQIQALSAPIVNNFFKDVGASVSVEDLEVVRDVDTLVSLIWGKIPESNRASS
ncbi:MAG: hypothetical protein HGA97_05735 [Chlorobiaceae bacterium]|jgi:hypothetical protein|nr:hypothetical protein [Chlorobiaceae bacterium]